MVYTVSMYIQMSALILFYVGGGGGLTVGCRRKKEGVRVKLKKINPPSKFFNTFKKFGSSRSFLNLTADSESLLSAAIVCKVKSKQD